MALVTTLFEAQGQFVARASGMSTVPQTLLPHPVAGTSADAMAALAETLAPTLWARLLGRAEEHAS